ncbi:MAG: betaine-aldehyde dehydrogenase [Leptospiraceae bacterium]|nr:betaine-aldehyde dehydrogenase [Leptospiraceae bacterium]
MFESRLYIHGQYQDASSPERLDNIYPATGQKQGAVHLANEADLASALQSARQGLLVWSAMKGAERGRILHKAAAILRQRNDELARLEVLDTGKPLSEALVVDVISGAECLEYYAGLAASLHGHHYDLGQSFAYTRREPLGIVAGIGAWNYPLQIACWKSAPALACGNAMIFKPSEWTPLTALLLAEIYTEAGLPAGVFNVLPGDRRIGQALVRSPQIAKVSLTGEVGTGKKVMAEAAATLKHVTLELGGKSPLLVFARSDLDQAISAAIMANFYTQGEVCSNGTRVFVEASVYSEFKDRLQERMRGVVIGDPMDPKTNTGALIHAEHLAKVMSYLNAAREAGAHILCGGHQVHPPGFEGGYFVQPTVIADCVDTMPCVREEIFGPVMSLLRFDSEEEVIRRANETPYGLAAGVFTKDLQQAHRVVARLEAGTCWINNYNLTPIEMPFGGTKQSGLGRENSLTTIEHYTQLKSVYVEMGRVDSIY